MHLVRQLPDVIQDRLRHGVNTMGAFNKATVLLFSIHDFDEMINFWTPQKVQYYWMIWLDAICDH